jgi:transcriptional regulator with XRE-family HTH domain
MQGQAISERQIYRKEVCRRFGRYLAAARQQVGISQQTLADSAGINRDEVSRFERGLNCPRFDTALRLSAALYDDPLTFLGAVVEAVQADG